MWARAAGFQPSHKPRASTIADVDAASVDAADVDPASVDPAVWTVWTFESCRCGLKPQGFLSGVDGVDGVVLTWEG